MKLAQNLLQCTTSIPNFIKTYRTVSGIKCVDQHHHIFSKQRIQELYKITNCNTSDKGHRRNCIKTTGMLPSLSTYLSYQPAFFPKLLQLIVTLTCYTGQGLYLVSCVHSGKQVELAERNPPQQQQVSRPVVHLLKYKKSKWMNPMQSHYFH